jgi:rRNA maturation protein Nop10
MKQFYKCDDCCLIYRHLINKCPECGGHLSPIQINIQK